MEILLIAMLIGLVPAFIAKNKGRSFGLWWFYGAALFIIALPHALMLHQSQAEKEQRRINEEGLKKCPYCAELIKYDAKVCRFCNRDLSDYVPATAQQKTHRL